MEMIAPVVPPVPATPETPVAPPIPDTAARHFSALAKKERALVKEREAFKAERQAFEAEKKKIAELESKYGAKAGSPREALQRYGFSYKDATDFELNDGAPTAEQIAREAQSEVARLREEQAFAQKQAAEIAAKHAEDEKLAVQQEFRDEIKEFVVAKAEDYELIQFHDAYEVVYHTVEANFKKTGRLLSIPEACQMVEKFLEKRVADLTSTKKFAKLRSGDPQPTEGGPSRKSEAPAPTRTLDNSYTSSTPTLSASPRVEADRIKRALAALG